ncbi:MAG: hypothetical protein K8S18_16210 [Desulfobacula sp.]|nr:hypothetical protein [Desulfobacula sp.]
MQRKTLYISLSLLIGISIILILYSQTFIAWKGVVLDRETGKPVEGAVVVRSWDRVTNSFGGAVSRSLAFKETLSDKNGKFKIFRKFPSLMIPVLSWVEEDPACVYKPGYKFLELRKKTRVVKLTKIPTIPALRKKELYEARNYIDFDFKHQLNIFFQIINRESEFIETSFYLIDAQSLINNLKDTSLSEGVRKHAAKLLAETADMRATDNLISVLGDKHVDGKAIYALGKRKDPRAVKPLMIPRDEVSHIFRPHNVAKALVQIGTPAVEELCDFLKKVLPMLPGHWEKLATQEQLIH